MTRHLSRSRAARFPEALAFCLGVAGLGFALPADAATLRVFEKSVPREISVTGTHYDVDEKTGRAQLVVELLDESFEGRIFEESIAIPGLSFDRESGEVRYQAGNTAVTCAVRRKVLWATTYAPTPECRLGVRNEATLDDDGHDVHRMTEAVVEMTVREATRTSSR